MACVRLAKRLVDDGKSVLLPYQSRFVKVSRRLDAEPVSCQRNAFAKNHRPFAYLKIMPNIHILPEHLANQIAAGEVIERPASVIKELLENSLDAGATRLEIEAEGGGAKLLKVIDNGCGMDEDDVLLCLERHGTSKIRQAADLDGIATLGFRGEAIPSIAAVSRFSIISRPQNAELGAKATVEYGKLTAAHAVGCGKGTVIEARFLFGNTPARRKFLRSARTELHHIDEIVRTYALAHPEIGFVLRLDGREVFSLAPGQSLEERLRLLLQRAGAFIAVARRSQNLAINGLLLPPELGASAGTMLRLFVNGRAVRDRLFSHAVAEGMTGFLMKGRFPAGALHLSLPAGDVDVNVHPAKHEVRFRHGQDVHAFIVEAVRQAMRIEQRHSQERIFSPALRPEGSARPLASPPGLGQHPVSPWHQCDELEEGRALATAEPEMRRDESAEIRRHLAPAAPPGGMNFQDALEEAPAPANMFAASDELAGLRVVGQAASLYILCENAEGLVIIDQHAAHERLLYEELLAAYEARQLAGQRLLFPLSIELSPGQARILENRRDELSRLGFAIEEFGGATHIITAAPAFAADSDPATLLLQILQQFSEDKGDHSHPLTDILAGMACKAAVKAGRELNEAEIRELLKKMAKADMFSHCPHGRPVARIFSHKEVRQWFYRG
ncbi:MAG: DNA mismatch repair endonuclease MutL [Desulfobulbaceae bacterium]|jgi:DNA mismatch repair protein MutL|nr:DNA mismatch repair endonuclease MutL [Desulfobulbaceae bacterium]